MAEPTPPGDAVKPKRTFKLLLIPLALVALVGGGALTATQYPALAGVMHRVGGSGDAAETDESGSTGDAPVEYGVFAQIDGITVNPISTDGTRYLLANIGVEAAEEVTLQEVKERDIVVRDTIIKLLSARTVENLSSMEGRSTLKDDVRGAINSTLRKGQIDRVYFTQYVIQ